MRAWALARALRARARPLRAGDADRDAPVFVVRFMCSAACLGLNSIQQQLLNWAPKCSKFIPGWLQNPPSKGSKMCLGILLETSWLWFFVPVAYFRLQLASWCAPGSLGAQKK